MQKRKAGALLALYQAWFCADVAADTFDYIIVGGGTAGLVVASRLSESPSVSVAVIEPGGDERGNPNVTDPDSWLLNFNTHTDWAYQTVPQPGVNGKPMDYHQGKALGGSSVINGMTYIRADAAEIDAWEALGNPGWNFSTLFPYYLRSEAFTFPNEALQNAGVTYEPARHNQRGMVHTGYPLGFTTDSPYTVSVREAFKSLGVPHNVDPAGGNVYGVSTNPQTLDRRLNMRWDSARAYLHPAENRPNLKIIRGTGRRLTWASSEEETKQGAGCRGKRASGIEYITTDGKSVALSANKEVILSAGSLRSPLILEASGIGNPQILGPLGIEVEIDLPGVGENFQEQPNISLHYSGAANLTGQTVSQAFVSAADVFGASAPGVAALTRAELPRWAEQITSATNRPGFANRTTAAVETLLRLQHDLIFGRDNAPFAETLAVVVEGGVAASAFWILFPFSRGSVHLASAAVADLDRPVVDPRLNLVGFDLRAQAELGKWSEMLWRTEPLASLRPVRVAPGLDVLPENATDEQWLEFTRTSTILGSHNLGTASMMSRELGGVVDPQLKVYGTSNVRVVDMSIFPMQHSGHPTATLYAVAERAAEIIKQSCMCEP
ncbi:hypothetical protein RB595_006797 [Gaeumannomyces hyphopodioides]